MPIRLNLLAEAQAQEDQRRRDPVKRAVAISVLLILAMVIWSAALFFKAIMYKNEVAGLQARVKAHEQDHAEVMSNMKQLAEVNQKLTALQKLSTNRFLVGRLLDALQHATLEDVQLSRLRLDENYTFVPEVKGNPKRPSKPATVTEKI